MDKLTIENYSVMGLAMLGASESQAREIAAKLGRHVPVTFTKPHGWVFSWRHEKNIRVIIEAMNGGGA